MGSEIAQAMDTLLVPVGLYADEARRLLNIASTHTSTHGRIQRKLSHVEKAFAAHLLNAFGHCMVDIRMHLLGVSGEAGYPWEPAVPVDAAVDRAPLPQRGKTLSSTCRLAVRPGEECV